MPWAELTHLEAVAEVVLRSYLDQHQQLAWRMTITPRVPYFGNALRPPDPQQPPIVIEGAEIRDVVFKGLAEAKRLGVMPV